MLEHCFVVGRFPPPFDGQSVATRTLADLLDRAVTVDRVDLSTGESRLSEFETRFRFDRVAHYFSASRRLRDRLKTDRSAPVVWTSMSPVTLGHWRDMTTVVPALLGHRKTLSVLHRGTFRELFEHASTSATARLITRLLRGFVFLDDHLSDDCAPWIPADKRFVIPNTIDDAVVCNATELERKWSGRPSDRPVRLLFLSSMSKKKGYEEVVRAVHLLHERGTAVHATFVGRWESDEQEVDFRQMLVDLGIAGRVAHLGGVTDREAVRRLYLEADLFVLPTYLPHEAQPLTIIEALNAATPVIVTAQAGIPRMVEDGREALFVPPHAPEAIADAVDRLSHPSAWRTASEAARQRFERQFHPDTVRAQWLALLERL